MKYIISAAYGLVLFVFSVAEALAQVTDSGAGGLVPCSGASCSACDVIDLANNIIGFLIGLVALIFSVLAIVAGLRLVTSGGNTSAKEAAKNSLSNALIGFVIVLAAWAAVDTMMRVLVGDNGQIGGYGPWSEIQCSSQVAPGKVSLGGFSNLEPPVGGVRGGSGATGGSCEPVTKGACTPGNLEKYFPGRGEEASKICNLESGGNPISSQTDKCKNGQSFSGGLFQINIIAHADKIPGCNINELVVDTSLRNGKIGSCAVPEKTNANGVTYCPRWSCEIKNTDMYNTCMKAATNQETNLKIASELFKQSSFQPWQKSKVACGVI